MIASRSNVMLRALKPREQGHFLIRLARAGCLSNHMPFDRAPRPYCSFSSFSSLTSYSSHTLYDTAQFAAPSMSMRSPRGRSPVRSHVNPARASSLRRSKSPEDARRSVSRSPSPDHGRTHDRTPSYSRSRSFSRSRSRSRSRGGRRYRSQSYSRTPSPRSPPRSAKVSLW